MPDIRWGSQTATKHIFIPQSLGGVGFDLIATVETEAGATKVFSNHPDHLTGSNVVSNEDGNLEQLLDYYPFGGIRLDEKTGTFDEQRKFTGHEFDEDTNLHYYVQRYYNQDIGRFTSQDPVFLNLAVDQRTGRVLENPQLHNSYSYVANNPLKYVDIEGELGEDFFRALSSLNAKTNGSFMNRINAEFDAAKRAGGTIVSFAADYLTPLGDAKTLLTGTNFSGDSDPRALAALGLLTGGKGDDVIKALHRPYIRNWIREAVEKITRRTPDGRPIDPNLNTPIEGTPDLGHKPGEEFRMHKQQAEDAGLTQQQFNERMNNPDLYQLEDPSANRSHRFENNE